MAKISEDERAKCRVMTPTFRASYVHLAKPQSIKPNDKPKYSLEMRFEKSIDLKDLAKAIHFAKIAKWGPKENWPKKIESPVSDGDSEKYEDKEGYEGHFIVKASTGEDQKPEVFGEDGNPMMNIQDFYSGCYGRAYLYAFAWEYMGKNGVSFILNAVQKVEDGERLGGRVSAKSMFGPVAGASSAGIDEDFDSDSF